MKTNDIVKRGIDRNFIRECERQGLISPTRAKGKMVIDENYFEFNAKMQQFFRENSHEWTCKILSVDNVGAIVSQVENE